MNGPQPRQFATVAFGKDGGEHQFRRGAGRRRRRDAGHHITGDPISHPLP